MGIVLFWYVWRCKFSFRPGLSRNPFFSGIPLYQWGQNWMSSAMGNRHEMVGAIN